MFDAEIAEKLLNFSIMKITIILPGNHRGRGSWRVSPATPLTDHTVSYNFSRFLPDSVVIIAVVVVEVL